MNKISLNSVPRNKSVMSSKTLTVGFLAFSFMLCSCAKFDAAEKNAAGGVDGSGGNLPYIVDSSFQDWVEHENAFYVRDVLHRLKFIVARSPDAFSGDDKRLIEKFLGSAPNDAMSVLSSVKFKTVAGGCRSKDHASSDAAVSTAREICYSYSAFKNLSVEDAVRKLIAMTAHEISHLQGFEEKDAVRLQLLFDSGRLGNQTILFYNRDYRNSRKSLTMASDSVSMAFRALLERSPKAKSRACRYLSIAHHRATDFFFDGQILPRFLFQQASDSFIGPIGMADSGCDERSPLETIKLLVPILKASVEFARLMEQFESPHCQGELCVPRRGFLYNPEELINEWSGKEKHFTTRTRYPIADEKKVSCSLQSWPDGKVLEMKKESDGYFKLDDIGPHSYLDGLNSIFFRRDELHDIEPSEVVIVLNHGGNVQLLESSGFTANHFDLRGVLQPESMETATVRFAVMDPMRDPPRRDADRDPLAWPLAFHQKIDPFFGTIRKAPPKLAEFKLTCNLTR